MIKFTLFRLLLFSYILIFGLFSFACGEKNDKEEDDDIIIINPDLTVAHGGLIDNSGNEISPTSLQIIDIQKYYISIIKKEIGDSQTDIDIRKNIFRLVEDEVLANALFIDWLIDEVNPKDSINLNAINNALRGHYMTSTNKNGFIKDKKYWSKGIPFDVADRLEKVGIRVYTQIHSGIFEYLNACRVFGVPTPEKLFDGKWDRIGVLENQILFPGQESEMWMYTSNDPKGFCLSLSRSRDGNRTGLLDVICFGIESSCACFFESELPNGMADESYPLGVVSNLSQLNGGRSLGSACTSCHAGENPFIVHPDEPVFIEAYAKKLNELGPPANLMGNDWYNTVGLPGGLANARPRNNLTNFPNQIGCTSCHNRNNAGRFPDIPDPFGDFRSYCSHVLKPSIGIIGTGNNRNPNFNATMPQGSIDDIRNFIGQINELVDACGHSGGLIVSPPSFNFGNVVSNQRLMRDDAFTITCTGGGPVIINNIVMTGQNANSFSFNAHLPNPFPLTMRPGESFPISISFESQSLGQKRADLEISTSVPSPFNTLRAVVVANSVPPGLIQVFPDRLNFGNQEIGSTTNRLFMIQNIGSSDLRWRIATPAQPNDQFSWPNNFASNWNNLSPGEFEDVPITFNPSVEGLQTMLLSIENSDRHVSVQLAGQSFIPPDPEIQVLPNPLNFGVGILNESIVRDLTISNPGLTQLTVSSMNILGSFAFGLPELNFPIQIEGGNNFIVPVEFHPLTRDRHQGYLQIQSNVPNSNISVPLSGLAAYPDAFVGSTDVDYGGISNSINRVREILIYNLGSAQLTTNIFINNEQHSVTGVSINSFHIINAEIREGGIGGTQIIPISLNGKAIPANSSTLISIPSGGFLRIEIRLSHPSITGPIEAGLQIFTNDLEAPATYVTLRGIAQ